jgi:tight adherence protein B
MAAGPLLFGLLVGLAILVMFAALWQTVRTRDPVEERMEEYGAGGEVALSVDSQELVRGQRRAWVTVGRILAGFGLGPRLAKELMRADVPLTAAEFALIMTALGIVGFAIGTLRMGLVLGLVVGAVAGYAPYAYLGYRRGRRQRAFTEQLPDILTLLVGALRAGYGLTQAMAMLVEELPDPAAKEFTRVMRSIELGSTVQNGLREMADRVGSDDLDLVVTAISVQYEMGGNLAQTLDTIGETVRDRIRILREIRVLTAQQRITGYVLAVWPFIMGVILFLMNPSYMGRLFRPDMRLVPVVAVVMQVMGFLVIRKIVDIDV